MHKIIEKNLIVHLISNDWTLLCKQGWHEVIHSKRDRELSPASEGLSSKFSLNLLETQSKIIGKLISKVDYQISITVLCQAWCRLCSVNTGISGKYIPVHACTLVIHWKQNTTSSTNLFLNKEYETGYAKKKKLNTLQQPNPR